MDSIMLRLHTIYLNISFNHSVNTNTHALLTPMASVRSAADDIEEEVDDGGGAAAMAMCSCWMASSFRPSRPKTYICAHIWEIWYVKLLTYTHLSVTAAKLVCGLDINSFFQTEHTKHTHTCTLAFYISLDVFNRVNWINCSKIILKSLTTHRLAQGHFPYIAHLLEPMKPRRCGGLAWEPSWTPTWPKQTSRQTYKWTD